MALFSRTVAIAANRKSGGRVGCYARGDREQMLPAAASFGD